MRFRAISLKKWRQEKQNNNKWKTKTKRKERDNYCLLKRGLAVRSISSSFPCQLLLRLLKVIKVFSFGQYFIVNFSKHGHSIKFPAQNLLRFGRSQSSRYFSCENKILWNLPSFWSLEGSFANSTSSISLHSLIFRNSSVARLLNTAKLSRYFKLLQRLTLKHLRFRKYIVGRWSIHNLFKSISDNFKTSKLGKATWKAQV